MTRMVVALEGHSVNNCIIEPGALRCEDDEVPVNWGGNSKNIIGRASSLERDGDKVTMEVELDPTMPLDLDDNIGAYVYVQPFKSEDHFLIPGAIRKVTSGRIREVSLHDLGT